MDRVGLDPDEDEAGTDRRPGRPGAVDRRGPRLGPRHTASTCPIADRLRPEVHQAWEDAHRQ